MADTAREWRSNLEKKDWAVAIVAALLGGLLFGVVVGPDWSEQKKNAEKLSAEKSQVESELLQLQANHVRLAEDVENKAKAMEALRAENAALQARSQQATTTAPQLAPPGTDTAPATTSTQPPTPVGENFAGKWDWGQFDSQVRLRQSADGSVRGEYGNGEIPRGRVTGNQLEFSWRSRSGAVGNGLAVMTRNKIGVPSVKGKYCAGDLNCDPDDPRQRNAFQGTPTDW